jgi:hypothetical protein
MTTLEQRAREIAAAMGFYKGDEMDSAIAIIAPQLRTVSREATERERERCAALVRQVAAEDDESELGENAAVAFNAHDRRPMSERLRDWNEEIAKGIESAAIRACETEEKERCNG